MKLTSNLGLKKPEGTDVVNIDDLNKNADVLDSVLGDMSTVPTASKQVAGAIKELFQSASDGKNEIAAAITGMNQPATAAETFAQLAAKILAISTDATAQESEVLSGQTFYKGGQKRSGTMTNLAGKQVTGEYTTADVGVEPHHSGGNYLTVITKPRANGYMDEDTIIQTWIANLTADKIQAGVTVGPTRGKQVTGTFTADANALPQQIQEGRIAYVNGKKVVGTLPDRGDMMATLTQQGQQFTIPWGRHNGAGKVTANISNLAAANIKAGVSVGGVSGTFTSDANATAADIRSGRTAYVNGNKLTGTLIPLSKASGQIGIGSGGSGSYANYRIVNISGLGFKPKAVYVEVQHSRLWKAYGVAYNDTDSFFNGVAIRTDSSGTTIYDYIRAIFTPKNNGFSIYVAEDSSLPVGTNATWWALG